MEMMKNVPINAIFLLVLLQIIYVQSSIEEHNESRGTKKNQKKVKYEAGRRRKMVLMEPEDVGLIHTEALHYFHRRMDLDLPRNRAELEEAIVDAVHLSLCDEEDVKCRDGVNATISNQIESLEETLLLGPDEGLEHVLSILPSDYDTDAKEAITRLFDGFSLLNNTNHEAIVGLLNIEMGRLRSSSNIQNETHRSISLMGLSVGIESTKQWIETIRDQPRSLASQTVRACESRSFVDGTTHYGPVFPWEKKEKKDMTQTRGDGGNHVGIYHSPEVDYNNVPFQDNNLPPGYVYQPPATHGPYNNNHLYGSYSANPGFNAAPQPQVGPPPLPQNIYNIPTNHVNPIPNSYSNNQYFGSYNNPNVNPNYMNLPECGSIPPPAGAFNSQAQPHSHVPPQQQSQGPPVQTFTPPQSYGPPSNSGNSDFDHHNTNTITHNYGTINNYHAPGSDSNARGSVTYKPMSNPSPNYYYNPRPNNNMGARPMYGNYGYPNQRPNYNHGYTPRRRQGHGRRKRRRTQRGGNYQQTFDYLNTLYNPISSHQSSNSGNHHDDDYYYWYHDDDYQYYDDYYYNYHYHDKKSKQNSWDYHWDDDDGWHGSRPSSSGTSYGSSNSNNGPNYGNTNFHGNTNNGPSVVHGSINNYNVLPPKESPAQAPNDAYWYPSNTAPASTYDPYFNPLYGYPCIEGNLPPAPTPAVNSPTNCVVSPTGGSNDSDDNPLFAKIIAVVLSDVIGAIVGATGNVFDVLFDETTQGNGFSLENVAASTVLVASSIRSIAASILAFFAAFLNDVFLA